MHAIALLLEHDDVTVRPEALVGIANLGEMAVCTLVPCGTLACRSHTGTIVLAVNNIVLSIASNRRNSDGPRFYIGNKGDRWISLPYVGQPLEPPDQSELRRQLDEAHAATRVSNATYHLAVTASNVLLDSELSEQSSSMGQGRFFRTAFGRTSNHHSSDSDMT